MALQHLTKRFTDQEGIMMNDRNQKSRRKRKTTNDRRITAFIVFSICYAVFWMTLNPFQVVVQDDRQLDLLFTSSQPEAEAEAEAASQKQKQDQKQPSITIDEAKTKTKKTIPVFYNIFVKDKRGIPKAKAIFDEQYSSMLPEHKLFVVSLGYDITQPHLQFVPNDDPRVKIIEQRPQGDERVTMNMLWQNCQVVPDEDAHETLVVYLHSKGSFHPSRANNNLRKALTAGALSKECAELPNSCNVCSVRMSPVPFPHTPGNMWVSRCSYVKKLVSPITFQSKMDDFYKDRHTCNGRDRWSQEHYIHHHKDVKPCDLLEKEAFTWSYDRIPGPDFKKDLQPAPRFNLTTFLKPKTCDGFGTDVRQRLELSHLIYNDTAFDNDWYGWNFFPNATELASKLQETSLIYSKLPSYL